ncbi:MAG: response regulator [Lachnospiraceae bacterium]|nr:response regulator [Lachnospiraceae bacterium]MDD7326435.1 response regulator [Lachnospiraceae bacterium]MDY2759181.1 response regulator [Lachnospiraceae bacterium]
MQISYNIWFEVSASIVLAVMAIYLPLQYDMRLARNRGFFLFAIMGLAVNVLDVVTAITISNSYRISTSLNLFLNTVYFMCLGLICMFFVRYSYIIAPERDKRADRYISQFTLLMFAVYIVLLIINIPTGIIVSFTRYQYVHGPLYRIVFFYPYLMVGLAFIRMLVFADELQDIKKKILMIFYFSFCVAASLLQLIFFPRVLLSLFALSIGMIFMMMLMETPDYQSLLLSMEKLEEAEKFEKDTSEKLQKSSREKNDFLAELAHMLRTPINAVVGYSELILKDQTNALNDARQIMRAGTDLLSITENINNMLELEDNVLSISEDNYSTSELIQDMKQQLYLYNKDKKLDVELNIDPGLPEVLTGDRIRILQIMNVLVSDAIRDSDTGSIIIDIDHGGAGFTYSVENTGNSRNDDENADAVTEFGLRLARKMLGLMGSELKHDESDSWNRYWFYLAQKSATSSILGEDRANELMQMTAVDDEINVSYRRPVLVADDTEMNRDIITQMLTAKGYRVDTAKNGEEAVEMVRKAEQPYSIIFMDDMMPVLNGIEALKEIRDENLSPKTPIIALAADATTDSQRRFIRLGFASYILKPVTEEKIMAAIRKYMSDKTIRSSIYTLKKKEQPKEEKQKKTLRIEDSDELEKQIMTLVLSDEYQIVNDGWASVYITDSREMLSHARPAIFITDGNDGGMAMALGASEVIERPVVAGLLRKRLVRVLSDERRQGR